MQHPPSREHPQYADCKHAADTSFRVINFGLRRPSLKYHSLSSGFGREGHGSSALFHTMALCGKSVHLESAGGRASRFAKHCCSFFADFHLLCFHRTGLSAVLSQPVMARNARSDFLFLGERDSVNWHVTPLS